MTRDTVSPATRQHGVVPRHPTAEGSAGIQYLTFLCNGQQYGVEILRVQEIKGWDRVVRIPRSPDFVLGLMNLRGSIVPVVELRHLIRMDTTTRGASSVVIVVRAGVARQFETVGIMVDAVADVCHVDQDEVRAPPEFAAAIDRAFVSSIATIADDRVMLLDIDKLVGCAATAPGEPAA